MSDEIEYGLVALKPDAIQRGLEEELYSQLEEAGLELVSKERKELNRKEVSELYSHVGRKDEVYRAVWGIHEYLEGKEVEAAVFRGYNVFETMEDLIGSSPYPEDSEEKTVRGSITKDPDSPFYSESKLYRVNHDNREWSQGVRNLLHFTDNKEEFIDQLKIFFSLENLPNSVLEAASLEE